MTEAHPTTQAKQRKTDEWAVFGDQSAQLDAHNDLVLIGRVEVPRFSQPTADGVELDRGKRLALAVHRAVQNSPHEPPEGEEFMVMTDLEEPMAFAQYEENPAFDGVWDPEEAEKGFGAFKPEFEDGEDEGTLEKRALKDLDAIAEISDHALAELQTGELDELEGSLRAIHERAEDWEENDD